MCCDGICGHLGGTSPHREHWSAAHWGVRPAAAGWQPCTGCHGLQVHISSVQCSHCTPLSRVYAAAGIKGTYVEPIKGFALLLRAGWCIFLAREFRRMMQLCALALVPHLCIKHCKLVPFRCHHSDISDLLYPTYHDTRSILHST